MQIEETQEEKIKKIKEFLGATKVQEVPKEAVNNRGIDFNEIPIEKQEAIKKYCADLRKKFPQMKPNRITRKAAEYFKIRLV